MLLIKNNEKNIKVSNKYSKRCQYNNPIKYYNNNQLISIEELIIL